LRAAVRFGPGELYVVFDPGFGGEESFVAVVAAALCFGCCFDADGVEAGGEFVD
jgi:hypothetical protein